MILGWEHHQIRQENVVVVWARTKFDHYELLMGHSISSMVWLLTMLAREFDRSLEAMSWTTPCHCSSVSVKPGVKALLANRPALCRTSAQAVVAVLCCRVARWSSTSTPLRLELMDTFTPFTFPI